MCKCNAFTCVHNRCFLPFKTVKVWNRSKLVFKLHGWPLLVVRQDQLSLNQKVQVLAIFLGRMAYSQKCFDQSWCNGQRGWRTTILHPWPICWPICCQRSRILAWHRLVNGIWKVTSRWWSRTAPCCYEKFQPYFGNVSHFRYSCALCCVEKAPRNDDIDVRMRPCYRNRLCRWPASPRLLILAPMIPSSFFFKEGWIENVICLCVLSKYFHGCWAGLGSHRRVTGNKFLVG